MPRSKVRSILRYLAKMRQRCTEQGLAWEADDYQLAYLVVLYATRGIAAPEELAYRNYYGVHPNQLFLKLQQRERAIMGESVWKERQTLYLRTFQCPACLKLYGAITAEWRDKLQTIHLSYCQVLKKQPESAVRKLKASA